ncbi:uncharacterized protein EI97DRAFT_419629 [Westerdykella ornata]|uniref:RBR-type E3 ubiquitin transferase n=1 Tax=Westerdykella ornata TaxID=318751 RepID=A0A6A6JHQ2_WESOR|nr:uncharacterized protein EI97DRAFT_419629 [Westerdykella ornata]KAF2275942.1 hypothetical protein EI97DRAFT_419629 [Westerdykella ornata]
MPADQVAVLEGPLEGTRECVVCSETYGIEQFPTSAACTHEPEVCGECYDQSINAQLDDKAWDNVGCPTEGCDVVLQHADIHEIATQATQTRYDEACLQSVLAADPDFRHCQRPDCNSGQIHENGTDGPIFRCQACGFRLCVIHNVPWHEDETCEHYDLRVKGRENEEQLQAKASLKVIDETTKKCPGEGCSWPIEKNGGCNHMTCEFPCYRFCWLCLAPYQPIRDEGNHRHYKHCELYVPWRTSPPEPRITIFGQYLQRHKSTRVQTPVNER